MNGSKMRMKEVGVAGVIAGIVVACSGGAMEVAGDVLDDAGQMLMDAGMAMVEDAGPDAASAGGDAGDASMLMDAGQMFMDAGEVLLDAATALTDASDATTPDAQAQSCAQCTTAGAVRMITADSDPSRLVSGSSIEGSWTQLTEGPFVVTDFVPPRVPFSEGTSSAALATADPGDCAGSSNAILIEAGTARHIDANGSASHTERTHGARLVVPAGKVLCASVSTGRMYWSGFRPYD